MSIAISRDGAQWTLLYNNGDSLPTNQTEGYKNMPDKSSAMNVDDLSVRFFNRDSQTWTS